MHPGPNPGRMWWPTPTAHTVQRVVVTLPKNSKHWNPDLGKVVAEESRVESIERGKVLVGRCNETHTVEYREDDVERPRQRGDTDHVVRVRFWHGGPEPRPLTRKGADDVLLFLSLEPPSMMRFRGVNGFDGEVSFRQDSTIWRPLQSPALIKQGAMSLRYEPERDSIGLWVDSCASALRSWIMDKLLSSGLRVESYGDCRRNRPLIGRLEEDANAVAACRRHRLMLAVQHSNCAGYVTQNLWLAMRTCGAIPIVATIANKPDYSVFGRFPYVDASNPHWLDRIHAIMNSNATYARFLRTHHPRSDPKRDVPLAAEALAEPPGGFHCQWFSTHSRIFPTWRNASWSKPTSERVQWEGCSVCEGVRVAQNRRVHRHIPCPAHWDGVASVAYNRFILPAGD